MTGFSFSLDGVYPRVSHFIPCVMHIIQTNFVNVEHAVSEDSLLVLAVLAVQLHVLCLYTTWRFNITENNYANLAFLCFDFVRESYSVS